MASTYLTRTPSSTGNRRKFTFSAWVKFNFTSLVNNSRIFSIGNSTSDWVSAYFNSTGTLQLDVYVGGSGSNITTNRVFRDENAWYHVVFVVDTENSTADNRLRMYVNCEEETSLSSRSNPNVNWDTQANTSGKPVDIGSAENVGYSPRYFPGIMSHVHMTDGYAYAASDFGSTDSTTGEWRINTAPSVSYGTNGFFILKDGNSVTDQSGNSNNFTVAGGTLTNTEDCPSNVFATFNPLDNYYPAMTLSYGNTRALTTAGKYTYTPSTLGMTSGKYYCEIKCTAQSGSQNEFLVGITSTETTSTTAELGNYANDYGYNAPAGKSRTNNVQSTYGATFTTGDIIGIAVDLDNNKLYFHKNGTYQNSGDPTSGSTGTGALSITDPASTSRGAYFFACCYFSSTDTGTYDANFGNGYFGTTAVSSAGTNASGIGIFEYDVPAGYTALSTKGFNE